MITYMIVFFKQKTAYEMRISDWSSDVCSSDLWNENGRRGEPRRPLVQRLRGARLSRARRASPDHDLLVVAANHRVAGLAVEGLRERGHVRRRADRAAVGQGVLVGLQALVELFLGDVAAPHRRPSQAEALLAGQAVGPPHALAGGGLLPRCNGPGPAAAVGVVPAT